MLLHKTLHKTMPEFIGKTKIIFYLTVAVFSLCTKEVMPMESQAPANIEQLNYIRKTFLEYLITQQKDTLVSKFNVTDDTQTTEVKGDIFLAHNQYELIGTLCGHLIIADNLNKLWGKIKAHRNAVSCLAAQNDIVATGSRMDNVIRRWKISTFKMYDEISCQQPIIFMHLLNSTLFIVDIEGNIVLRDWKSGCFLGQIKTKIPQPVFNALLDAEDDSPDSEDGIIIMASEIWLSVKISTLIDLDASVCSLSKQQIASIYSCITSSSKTQDYTKCINDANLPLIIKDALKSYGETL